MPEISRFYGIVITMYYAEHGVPHFHARYGTSQVSVDIDTGTIRGRLAPTATAMVLEWLALHRRELAGRARAPASSASPAFGVAMDYDVVEARYVRAYVIWLRFRDGTSGEIDLEPELWGQIFEPLRDLDLFRQFTVHPEFETLVWPNGADMAPEFLHDNIRTTFPAAHGQHRPVESK